MLYLGQDKRGPLWISADFHILYSRLSSMFLTRYNYVLPALLWMEDSIAINPTVPYVLYRVEDNPSVRNVDEIKVTQIREKVGLHNS